MNALYGPRNAALLALLGLLTGCAAGAVKPLPAAQSVRLPDQYAAGAGTAAGAAAGAGEAEADRTMLVGLLPWQDGGFATLSQAMLADAPRLDSALARVEAARAAARGAGARRLPAIGYDASVGHDWTNPDSFGAALPPGVAIDNSRTRYGASLTASWDADLFGRLKAGQRAAMLRADATEAEARAVRLAMLAELAGLVTDWRTAEARGRIAAEDRQDAEALLHLAGVRAKAGLVPEFDAVRARSLLRQVEAQIPLIAAEQARITGALVALTGRSVDEVRAALAVGEARAGAAVLEGERPVPAFSAGLPADLLKQRPDLIAAAHRLAAADADLAAAAAARFPTLSLKGAVGLLAFAAGDLVDGQSVVGSLAAGLAGPLLDFGRIAADVDARRAEGRAAFADYRGAVFRALGESEAALVMLDAARARGDAARAQARLDRDAAMLAHIRYRNGLTSFLTVLDAQRSANASRAAAVMADGETGRAMMALWLALGGHDA